MYRFVFKEPNKTTLLNPSSKLKEDESTAGS